MLELVAAQIDFVFRDRVEHERVVRVRRMSQGEDFRFLPHCRTLSVGGKSRNLPMFFDCHLRSRYPSDSLRLMAKMAKTGLGKGLGALIGTRPSPVREDVD